ncbi:MAG: exopolysaccharide biosynthesis protein [bacterium]
MKKEELSAQEVKTLGQVLAEVIAGLPGGDATVSLGSVLKLLERDGFLLICVFLAIPFMVPVSIPGMSTICGLVMLLIGLSIIFNRNPPLPKRLTERLYPSERLKMVLTRGLVWVHRIERISRPRLLMFTNGMLMERLNGLMIVIGALLLIAPLPMFPFSNTFPGLAVLFISIGLLQRDGFCVLLGYITTICAILYFAILAVATVWGLGEVWQMILQCFKG